MPPPLDDATRIKQLMPDPDPIQRRMRAQTRVIRVASARRSFVAQYDDTRMVSDDPEPFSSHDPRMPMQPAFAHRLMRKDGAEHRRERMAMNPARAPGPHRAFVIRPRHGHPADAVRAVPGHAPARPWGGR